VLPTSVTFTSTPGTAPAAQMLTVYDVGGQALTWTATPDDNAITDSPATGNVAAGSSHAVTMNVAAQATAGVRTQHVLFDAGPAGSVRVTVRIEFTSGNPPPPGPGDTSVWPKFHRTRSLNGRSRVDTSGNGGRVRWKAAVGAPAACQSGSQTGGHTRCGTYLASPVLGNDGSVYQLGGDGNLRAFDRADGSLKWATMTAVPSIAPQESTPTVATDGTIFLNTGGRFFHLDAGGNVLASATAGFTSSPVRERDSSLWMANAGDVAVESTDTSGRSLRNIGLSPSVPLQTMAGALGSSGGNDDDQGDDQGEGSYGYWTGNGNVFLTSSTGLAGSFTSPQTINDPLYPRRSAPTLTRDGLVIYAYQYPNGGGVYSTRIYAFQVGSVQSEYWHLDLPRTGGVAGLPSGPGLTAADEADAMAFRSGTSSPAVGPDGTIYVGHLDGLYAVQNAPTGAVQHGRVLWSIGTAQVVSSPAVGADGRIYFGATDGFLYCAKDGNVIWQVRTGGPVNSSPAIGADGTVFATSDDGWLYAVK
jgi:outer membrane protein assembly factor BamB